MSFAKRSAVQDRDHGWRGITRAVAATDGLELRVGLLNWRLRYPKDRGGTEIAKVAGIHGVYAAVEEGFNSSTGLINTELDALMTHLLAGKPGISEFIYRRIGVPVRDTIRERAMQIVEPDTRRLRRTLIATVFDDVKPGRKGAGHVGKVVAGDNPQEPKPSQRIA